MRESTTFAYSLKDATLTLSDGNATLVLSCTERYEPIASPSPEGTWGVSIFGGLSITLDEDGTWIASDGTHGDWSTNGNVLKVYTDGHETEWSMVYSAGGNVLTLVDSENGYSESFIRR